MNNGNANNAEYNKKAEKAQLYAITITYKSLNNKTPYGQFRETAPYITSLLAKSTTFKIVPEWRITNGSIHYHGTINIVDRIKWLKQTLPSIKSLGFLLVKPIDNNDKWESYLAKELDIARGIVKELSFPLDKEVYIEKKKKKVDYPDIEEVEMEIMTEADQAEENAIKDYTP